MLESENWRMSAKIYLQTVVCHIMPALNYSFNVCVCRICPRHEDSKHSTGERQFLSSAITFSPSLPLVPAISGKAEITSSCWSITRTGEWAATTSSSESGCNQVDSSFHPAVRVSDNQWIHLPVKVPLLLRRAATKATLQIYLPVGRRSLCTSLPEPVFEGRGRDGNLLRSVTPAALLLLRPANYNPAMKSK